MARELRRRGVQAWDVAGVMGYSSDQTTTEIYAEYDPGYPKRTVEVLDEFMNTVLNHYGACPKGLRKSG